MSNVIHGVGLNGAQQIWSPSLGYVFQSPLVGVSGASPSHPSTSAPLSQPFWVVFISGEYRAARDVVGRSSTGLQRWI